jgi:AcrR family transcriptional regulator
MIETIEFTEMARKRQISSKRERLLQTAVELFAKQGIHATGIDTVVAHAGVTKKTLYAHFRSKEELLLAALRHYDGLFRNEFMRKVQSAANTPRARLLAVFDVAGDWFRQQKFYGCLFIKTIGEYSQQETPIRQVCQAFKRLMKEYLQELCEEAGARDAERLAEELSLVLEGAIVTAQVSQKSDAAHIAKRAAKALLDQAIETNQVVSGRGKKHPPSSHN